MLTSKLTTVLTIAIAVVAATAHAAPPVEDVGEPDSFGHRATYLGFAQTIRLAFQGACAGVPPTSRCVHIDPKPDLTLYADRDLAQIRLPANASNSLLCFDLSRNFTLRFHNTSAMPQPALFSDRALITIDNPVLDDPSLIDPDTGIPYNGRMPLILPLSSDSHVIDAGRVEVRTEGVSRACIDGFASKQRLRLRGFTEKQADAFFAAPMTVSFGVELRLTSVELLSYSYGVRLYGDDFAPAK